MLPPLVPSSLSQVNGHSILRGSNNAGNNANSIPAQYQPYIIKLNKLKSIPRPIQVPSQGISGERIVQNKYAGGGVGSMIQDRVLNASSQDSASLHPIAQLASNNGGGSVSRTSQLQAANNSLVNLTTSQDGSKEPPKKVYKRKITHQDANYIQERAASGDQNIDGGQDYD